MTDSLTGSLADAEKAASLARPAKALPLAQELAQILEMEFEALQKQDLERFEQLQGRKTELLAGLSALCPATDILQTEPAWQGVLTLMTECRDLHRRNAMLIERKLEAIRGTLQSLQSSVATRTVEVYDRLGKVARFSRGRGYQEA